MQLEADLNTHRKLDGGIYTVICRQAPNKRWDMEGDLRRPGFKIDIFDNNSKTGDPKGATNQQYKITAKDNGIMFTVMSCQLQLGVGKRELLQYIIQENPDKADPFELIDCQGVDDDAGWYYIRLQGTNWYVTLESGIKENMTRFMLNELNHGFHQQFKFQ